MSYKAIWSTNENLNEVEHIKLEKDGLDTIHTIIETYGKEGYSSIDAKELNRLKWAGIYEQKPKDGKFMLRVRISSGILTSKQGRVLAGIAKEFGRGIANITTRGAIQFHWIQIEDLPEIFDRLQKNGMSSFEACGDCPRTIVGNPLAGIDPEELIDTTQIVNEVNDFFLLNKDFSNLPRKFKISISASTQNPAHAQINDISFTPATKIIDGKEVIGFHVRVGGGLSSAPYLAQKLDLFVKPEQVLSVVKGACTIFRDYGYREKRTRARLKFLIADWGIEKFQEKLEEFTGKMEARGEDKVTTWNASYYYGVHPQKQNGKKYIGINIPFGEITDDDLSQLAAISDTYGEGKIRTTLSQNLVLTGINDSDIPEVLELDIFKRLPPTPTSFIGYTVSCTGKQYCNLAIVETKQRAKKIIEYLDASVTLDKPVRIHFTGCANACGHKQIADISLQGALIKDEHGSEEAFTLWMGGTLEGNGKFADNLNYRVKASEAHLVLAKIILFFNENSLKEETFHQFVNRVGIEEIKSKIERVS